MDMEDEVSVFVIPDEVCSKTGITVQCVDENKFSVYAYNPVKYNSIDEPSKFMNSGDINIIELEKKFIFDEPILRNLVTESNSIFLSLQNAVKQSQRTDFIKISRAYRSAIRACLEKLQETISNEEETNEIHPATVSNNNNNDNTTSSVERYYNYVTIFYSVECIWHLCEILLINIVPSQIIVPQLLEWIRFHFPIWERKAAELLFIECNDIGETDDELLKVAKGLVLQGQVEVARTVLKLHSCVESISFKMAEEILGSMPIYNFYGGLSIQKFKSLWQFWRTDTESKLLTGCLHAQPELEEIIKLVTGDQETWINETLESVCWYEYLPGYLFYSNPSCKFFELGKAADLWLRRWATARGHPGFGNLKHLDRVLFNVMENNIHQLLHGIKNICDNQWFVTHLTDLLYHCGQLEIIGEHQTNVTVALRDSLLFEFGVTLMSTNLWIIGLDYLEHNSAEGIGAAALLLPKIAMKNEKYAMKIIGVAKSKGLTNVETEICHIQAVKSLHNKRYGNALEWAIRSQDNIFVTSVADIFLKHYAKTGVMYCHDVLRNIGAKMFISPRLVFLTKYFDFHQYYKAGKYAQAAELLVNLLDSKITPDYFWPSLLADTIPLLESEQPRFSSKETIIIQYHLEQRVPELIKQQKNMSVVDTNIPSTLSSFTGIGGSSGINQIENINEMINLIRLACVRNLSRALILENTYDE